jgi:transposase-like protein
MKHTSSPFKWRRYPPELILMCVRKYLNNVIEQDHRFLKKKVRASQCFKSFYTAEHSLKGIVAINTTGKGQVKRSAGSDAREQAKFLATLFQLAA